MKINAVNSVSFGSTKGETIKKILKQTTKSTDIKPIKNYSQYLKEYGLKPIKKDLV